MGSYEELAEVLEMSLNEEEISKNVVLDVLIGLAQIAVVRLKHSGQMELPGIGTLTAEGVTVVRDGKQTKFGDPAISFTMDSAAARDFTGDLTVIDSSSGYSVEVIRSGSFDDPQRANVERGIDKLLSDEYGAARREESVRTLGGKKAKVRAVYHKKGDKE